MGMRVSPDVKRKILELSARAAVEPHFLGVTPVSEKAFQTMVASFARHHGWLHYHTHDSRRSQAGFWDSTLIRGDVLIGAELKVGDNQPTADQLRWLEALAGVKVVRSELWRSEDWPKIEAALR